MLSDWGGSLGIHQFPETRSYYLEFSREAVHSSAQEALVLAFEEDEEPIVSHELIPE